MFETHPSQLSEALAWWLSGLRDLVPESVSRVFHRQRDTLYIEIADGQMRLTHTSAAHPDRVESHRFSLQDRNSPQRNAALSWLKRLRKDGARAVLLLPDTASTSKILALPLAAEENLRQVISFEMDRLTPFKADQVYFDYEIIEKDPDQKRLRLRLVVAPRQRIDQIVGQIMPWGIRPEAAMFKDAGDQKILRHQIGLSASGDREGRSSRRRMNLGLALLTIVLLVAVIAIPIRHKQQTLDELQQSIEKTRDAAQEAARMRAELEQLSSGSKYLAKRKHDTPLVIETLDRLAELIPDTAWLNRLQLNGKELNIQGQAVATTILIERLESSEHFTAAAFTSPVKQNSRTNKEQFNLTVEVSSKGTIQ